MVQALLQDKALKPRQKSARIIAAVLDGELTFAQIVAYAESARLPEQATLMEALVQVSQQRPALADVHWLHFAMRGLCNTKAPRLQWEAATLISELAKRFPAQAVDAIPMLEQNLQTGGTVVRWSVATALCAMPRDAEMTAKLEALWQCEQENGVKNVYAVALGKPKSKRAK